MKTRKMRVFPAWSFQQEENWLNDMAQQGWFLEAVSPFVYDFTAVEPGSYQIRLQLLTEAKESEKKQGLSSICRRYRGPTDCRLRPLGVF